VVGPSRRSSAPVPSGVYTTDYFLSEACEGFGSYVEGDVSKIKQEIVGFLHLGAGMRVLDVGCGRGDVMAAVLRSGVSVVGVDYAAAAVRLARDLVGPRVARADATALPFRSGTFDRAVMGDVIEHLPWDMAVAAVRDIARVLRPDGYLIVHTSPNRLFVSLFMPVVRIGLRLTGRAQLNHRLAEYDERKTAMHPNELSPFGLRKLLDEAGVRARVWVAKDIIRSGSGPWTEELASRRAVRILARIGGTWPLRYLLGNDLFASVRP
jgi:SAM-dependent methyltransferase